MRRPHSNRSHELEVFAEFAAASALRFTPNSAENREPPEPDIRCIAEDGPLYFELGRLLDNEMQRMKLEAARRAPAPVSLSDYAVKLPEREMLRTKLGKTYQTFGAPAELVLYYDNTNWLVGDVPVMPNFGWHARHVMQPLVDGASAFRRVWVFERHQRTVLWCGTPGGLPSNTSLERTREG